MQTVRSILCIFCIASATAHLLAQAVDKTIPTEKSIESRALENLLRTQETGLDRIRSLPMEGAVDANKYIVGPSDMFHISSSGPISVSYTVSVTPEGTLIVPTVGDLNVNKRTLAEVKRTVKEAVKKRYSLGEITVTLISPRSFVVTLRGVVLKQGQYIASAVDRVEKILIQGASSYSPMPTVNVPIAPPEGLDPLSHEYSIRLPRVNQATEMFEGASTRNILLIRTSGDTVHVDIPKFYATGQDRYNPFLLDGDIIFVPMRNLSRNFVAVYGAVNAPGRYEYAEGDSLLDVLQIAQGLTSAADRERILISRLDKGAESAEEFGVNLKAILEGRQPSIPILRGDRVVVNPIPEVRKNFIVIVSGEVKLPGTYPITRSSTWLSKILKEAGGITGNAHLGGSVIMRRDDRIKDLFEPQFEYLRMLRSQQLTPADSAYYNLDVRIGRHPVVVDFRKLIEGMDSTEDVLLKEDDVIYIASNNHTVLVNGQVSNPGYVSYIPGADYRYYVRKAGGFSEYAIQEEVRVIKKKTLEWLNPNSAIIEPGDQVWVPKERRKDFEYYFGIVRDIASITAAVTTTILLAIRIFQ